MRTRTLRSIVYLAGGLGLIISLFAAAEFFDVSLRAICSVSSFFSCAAVDNSGLTSTLGVPDYAWGIGGFVAILVVAALAERAPSSTGWGWALVALTTAGVALSGYLLYVELGEIGALCLVCASAYLMGGIAWLAAVALGLRTARRAARRDEEPEPAGAAS